MAIERLIQGLSELSLTQLIPGLAGIAIGFYTGLCGPKSIIGATLIETGIIIGLRLAKFNELANDLQWMLPGTLGVGLLMYLDVQRIKNKK